MTDKWTAVPEGYTLPGITRVPSGEGIRPTCGLSEFDIVAGESGWSGICDEFATWRMDVPDDDAWDGERTIWSCDSHRDDVLKQEADPRIGYGR